MIRDYQATDLAAVKAIHDSTEIDYEFPDVGSPIFLVKKVYEEDGVVRAALGAYMQVEYYLWLDKSSWATPEEKMNVIHQLNHDVTLAVWLEGVDQAVLWLPPGMERFGERLTDDFGFTKDRDGWVSYSRPTGTINEKRNQQSGTGHSDDGVGLGRVSTV